MRKTLINTAGNDKILFDTLQMACPALIGQPVMTIQNADYLSPENKHVILWVNATDSLEVVE
ncbi:hypothetical protein [Rhodohalobacter sp. 8-1]|uniref:hypothetical protein n=1 Tax=Rhodohalobacter sp. 8-1 TaxID=3131972 RepID=UPI0030EE58B5